MQGGENQVAGHGGAQTDIHGLFITHLTDQDDVRVLAQAGSQNAAKIQADDRVDLDLVNAFHPVLNRIFDCDYFR